MNEKKKQNSIEVEVNIKTRQKPFKRCFKHPTNTVTKFIRNIIDYGIYRNTECERVGSPRTGGRRKNKRYASIKGYCGLQRNGYLA